MPPDLAGWSYHSDGSIRREAEAARSEPDCEGLVDAASVKLMPMNQLNVKVEFLSGAVVVRGEAVAVRKLLEVLRSEASKAGVTVIHSTVSSRRLYIKMESMEP